MTQRNLHSEPAGQSSSEPLAARMRPRSLEEFFGQQHLLGHDRPLAKLAAAGRIHSMLLWGPPGTGKTTLARLLAQAAGAEWISVAAVLSGVKDIRAAIEQARQSLQHRRTTVLFVD